MNQEGYMAVCIHKCRSCAHPCQAAQLLWLPKTVVLGERF